MYLKDHGYNIRLLFLASIDIFSTFFLGNKLVPQKMYMFFFLIFTNRCETITLYPEVLICTPRLVNVDFILKQKVRLEPFSGFGAMKFAENKIQNIHNFVILDHSQKN